MNDCPGIDEALGLLERLVAAIRDFAARESALKRDHAARISAGRRKADEANREAERALAAALAAAEAALARENERLASRHEVRGFRIGLAARSSRQRALERVDAEEGRRKYEVQREVLNAEKNYPQDVKTAENAFGELCGRLAGAREELDALSRSARRAFAGYRRLLSGCGAATGEMEPAPAHDADHLLGAFGEQVRRLREALRGFRARPLPRFFSYLPLPALIPLIALLHGALFHALIRRGFHSTAHGLAGGSITLCLALALAAYARGRSDAKRAAPAIAVGIAKARRILNACARTSDTGHAQGVERLKREYDARFDALEAEWARASEEAVARRESATRRLAEKEARARARNERRLAASRAHREQEHAQAADRLKAEAAERRRQADRSLEAGLETLRAGHDAEWRTLEAEWRGAVDPIYAAIRAANAFAGSAFPEWQSEQWRAWVPPRGFAHAVRFARASLDLAAAGEVPPQDPRLALPGPSAVEVPLLLTFPERGSILIETWHAGREEAVGVLNNIVLRLLSATPPGKLDFTILDPVDLGQNFAGVMHLTDYEENLVSSRIWTQPRQIEQRLSDLNEHMEKVIQMYLRNEYETIAQYNEHAGEVAEKYHFLVVADFPVNFSEAAARRLLSIAASGARCGVYTLIHWDRRRALPADFVPEELRRGGVCLSRRGEAFAVAGPSVKGMRLSLDAPPGPDDTTAFLHRVGKASVDSSRVEVPFVHVAPGPDAVWSLDTAAGIRVPIGRTGATKLQYLDLGKDTRQHVLIAGKTGAGKSTLFHVLITNLALWYGPDQIEFYLVDFKKGVEFKCYAVTRLAHARVVAIESDREFGMSVLERVDQELKRRGDRFRELGVQDIAGYRRAGGTGPMPRTLLVVDEFQEFFVADDRIAQNATLLLDRIVRQGRAFGLHVLLGSQTLGGAYTLARTTLGQMAVRIALQCNEADAYLIMDDGNPAPRLLSRPGEAIYNDAAGTIEGNSPFQVVWLPDHVREEWLARIRDRAERSAAHRSGPIVFEGNAPADVRENPVLRGVLEAGPAESAADARVWLGAPNSIKGPTEAVFRRQGGHNLLVVGQNEQATQAMLALGLVALAAQYRLGAARFVLLETAAPGSPQRALLDRVARIIPHGVEWVTPGDLAEAMGRMAAEMETRGSMPPAADAPVIYAFVHGLENFKKLRREEDFAFSLEPADTPGGPAKPFERLICEGASIGCHVVATCDTYNNVSRCLSRKALSEFEMRVLFQMSTNDSASLIDSPEASNLGLHRAVLFNEHEGYLEVFRPYAPPDDAWLEEAARCLARGSTPPAFPSARS